MRKEWHTDDLCPICHKEFKSRQCPHSIAQVELRLLAIDIAGELKKLKKIEEHIKLEGVKDG